MRVGIISDTHGLLRPEVQDGLKGVDMIIHAGEQGFLPETFWGLFPGQCACDARVT